MKEKLILVGNGMAGVRTLEELLKIAPDMYDITVFGAEPYGNYNRIMLSPVPRPITTACCWPPVRIPS
jgi:nitrite reductase (NADH) large subunit